MCRSKQEVVTFNTPSENHEKGAWQRNSLSGIVSYLDAFGYDCFWSLSSGAAANDKAGAVGKLFRVTGCWAPQWEPKYVRRWSNLACGKRGSEELRAMERFVVW